MFVVQSRERGFGLLEAIVALAILAGAGLALFSWIGQTVIDVRRVEEAQARAALQLTAMGLVANVNPFAEPKGERRVGALRVQWNSALIEPLRYSLPFAGAASPRWQVGLYRLDVVGVDDAIGTRVEFSLEQVGLNGLAVQPLRREDMP